jgi:hypothetical protein
MSYETGMAWEFSREGKWNRVVSPLDLGAWLPGDSIYDVMCSNGYLYEMETAGSGGLRRTTIYKSMNDEASIVGSATLCFSRWIQRRGRQLH